MGLLKYLKKKFKDNKGAGFSLVLIALFMLFLAFYINTLEFEHNVYTEEKSRIVSAIIKASKAGIIQIDKNDNLLVGEVETHSNTISNDTLRVTTTIDKTKSNLAIEKLIKDNALIIGTKETQILRDHLVLRAYTEPRADGSIQLTMYDSTDYDSNVIPQIVNVTGANEQILADNLENEINNYLATLPINGSSFSLELTNTGTNPIPELKIDRPCVLIFLQDYPFKSFVKNNKLSFYYLSPVNIDKVIKD